MAYSLMPSNSFNLSQLRRKKIICPDGTMQQSSRTNFVRDENKKKNKHFDESVLVNNDDAIV